ncbi:MAG TPA: helical backbone metal receptor [Ramlibacter sp.]|jgi:iron complex transport system substrate-binding protein|uniref:ABC transporter substrate-binding protein n=1 Tax=Ramlibacter sp. TaxID=1917967 RepID=UPI002D37EBFA|nr:helical backbone metal receptor [Ramlibacter sp.]HZY18072.1 helical backbone metal receptor [Ramlibacter sp.]
MKKAWLLALLLALGGAQAAVEIHDDRGALVTLPQPPRRIVSLLPSLTETVCALGACERLVGVDNYSNWPAAVQPLPHVGGLEDASIERIVALQPDLVLLSTSSRALGRLEGLGVRVAALEPRTLADVRRVMGKVGQLLGSGEAARVMAGIEAGVDAAARELPPALRGTTVYFEVNSAPYAASEVSFIGELLARVGAANVVPGRLGPFPKLNPEFVVRADPQVIMVSDRHAQAMRDRPGWAGIRALRDGRVCMFTAQQGDVLVRPGPRMAEAAQLMVHCLRGELKGRPR